MSVLKVKKEISKLLTKEAAAETQNYPEIFIISDSKGKYILPIIPGRFRPFIHIYHRSAATIKNNIVEKAIEGIQLFANNHPVVFLWFGSCEITQKKGKYTEIVDHPFQYVEDILTEYRDAIAVIQDKAPTAKIFVLQCPYYSTYYWNKAQGLKYDTESTKKYRDQDQQLRLVIEYYNRQLELINKDWESPQIAKDQIISSKKKRSKKTKNKPNYNLLYDGVHPKRPLARLWLHRIVQFAARVSE